MLGKLIRIAHTPFGFFVMLVVPALFVIVHEVRIDPSHAPRGPGRGARGIRGPAVMKKIIVGLLAFSLFGAAGAVAGTLEAPGTYARLVDVEAAPGTGVTAGTWTPDAPAVCAGDEFPNVIVGTGGDQSDCLVGGRADDGLFGDAGSDVLIWGEGVDALDGDGAADHLDDGEQADELIGANGSDLVDGGGGTDTCSAGTAPDSVQTCEIPG